MRYRPEIDGLRAIAILAVVGFDNGVPGFKGGYVGVDVFFVVSGYLITGILAVELESRGRIDFRAFYARRARRLAPALVAMLLAVIVLGWRVFDAPWERQALAHATAAAVALTANLFALAQGGDYFDEMRGSRPLLHTWSLSVEEQFYLAWPALLTLAGMAARRSGRARDDVARLSVGSVLAASLVFRWLYAGGGASPLAFYLMPSRAWEMALGALVALRLPGRVLPGFASWCGLACVLAAVFHPGTLLLPASGTALIVAAGSDGRVARALSVRPLVHIGHISYAWYLWQWPSIVLAQGDDASLAPPRRIAVAAVALLLAELSHRYLERPVRVRRVGPFASDNGSLWCAAGASLALVAVSAATERRAAFVSPTDVATYERILRATEEKPALRGSCGAESPDGGLADPDRCRLGAASAPIAVAAWGDSHAQHLTPVLESFVNGHRLSVILRWAASCPPVLGDTTLVATPNGPCSGFNASALDEIRGLRAAGLSGVMLAASWRHYAGWPRFDGAPRFRPVPPKQLRGALAASVAVLRGMGLRVLIVAPMPETRGHVPKCLTRHLRDPEACDLPREAVERGRRELVAELRSLEKDGVRVYDPIDVLCDASSCPVQSSAEVLYRDASHLSVAGARRLYPDMKADLEWLAARQGTKSY